MENRTSQTTVDTEALTAATKMVFDLIKADKITTTEQACDVMVTTYTFIATTLPTLVIAEPEVQPEAEVQPEPEPIKLEPACDPAESVFPTHIICLEDGRKLKMLKRHLMSAYGLTPDQYREKWNLPADYPMTAMVYSAEKQEHAKRTNLGHHARRLKRAA